MKKKAFIGILAATVLAPSLALADTYEIYTYGNGNFLASIYNAMKMLIGSGEIATLAKFMLMLAFLMTLISSTIGQYLSSRGLVHGGGGHGTGAEGMLAMVKVAIYAVFVSYVLMIPRANVAIVDRQDPSQSQVVTDVPWANVVIAHLSSRIGDGVGRMLEDVIVPVDAVKFRNGGMALGAKYLNQVIEIQPPGAPEDYVVGAGNVPISTVLNEYFERCVLPEFVTLPGSGSPNAQGLRTLMTGKNLLTEIPAIGYPFTDPNTFLNAQFTTDPLSCSTAPGAILQQWDTVFNGWVKQYNYEALGNNPNDPGYLSTVRQIFERYFPNSTNGFKTDMMQLAVLNSLRSSMLAYDAKYNSGALAHDLSLKKAGGGWIEGAAMFNEMVHTIRNLLEVFVYGMSIFLPVFVALAGLPALIMFIKVNFFLQMWVPGYVILNAFADHQFAKVINDALYNTELQPYTAGMSFHNVENIREHANLILGYIGAFAWSIPTLAWGLLKGGDFAVSSAIQIASGGSGAQHTAQQTGAEVRGAGNVSIGNQNMGGGSFMASNTLTSQASMLDGTARSTKWQNLMTAGIGATAVGGAMALGTRRDIEQQGTFERIAGERGTTVEGLQDALTTMDTGQKAKFVQDWAEKTGKPLNEAAGDIAGYLGDKSYTELRGFQGIQDQAGGAHPLGDIQEAFGRLDSVTRMSVLGAMKDAGLTLEEYGSGKGYMEAVGTIAAASLIKGGALSKDEILGMKKAGLLTEAGRAQASEKLADMFGDPSKSREENVKGFQRQLSTWEGMNEYTKFNELQKFADAKHIDLKELMQMSKRNDSVEVDAQEAKKLGLPQTGHYDLFWDKNQGYVFRDEKSGRTFNHGVFGRFGTDIQRMDVNKSVYDHMNVQKAGGTEVTLATLDGVKTGHMVYDKELKQPIFVAGQERYGIDKSVVRYQQEQKDSDGKISTPAGYVLESVTTDPQTGKIVTGKTSSIHVSEGQVSFGGHDFKATVFSDTKTGKQLAVDGDSGRYWTRTYNQDSWTVHRDMQVSGEVFSSVVTKHFGDEAGQYVSDFMTGTKELAGTLGSIGIKRGDNAPGKGKVSGKTKEAAQSPRPTLYDAYGRQVK
ncbi:MAG: conjugal transfer protein TraG N-terminal domain-containing protein [Thermodesulfovibrionales bacterium]|jgi:hypothetical protein